MVAQAFGRFTWGVVLPEARDDLLDGSNTAAGLFGSLNVGAYLVGTVVVAWLASRSSLVGLVKIGLCLSTSGLAIASFTTDPPVLAAALVLGALGVARFRADETKEFIRVNAIAPGFIDTDLTAPIQGARPFIEAATPMGRFGDTDDIAWAAVYLASDEAKFVTGQVLSPNGGYHMSQ